MHTTPKNLNMIVCFNLAASQFPVHLSMKSRLSVNILQNYPITFKNIRISFQVKLLCLHITWYIQDILWRVPTSCTNLITDFETFICL